MILNNYNKLNLLDYFIISSSMIFCITTIMEIYSSSDVESLFINCTITFLTIIYTSFYIRKRTKPYLIFHFDINGTIIAGDSCDSDMKLNAKANELLAKNLYGKVTFNEDKPLWEYCEDETTEGLILFNDFAKKYLNSDGGNSYKEYVNIFVDTPYGEQFKKLHSEVVVSLSENKIFGSFTHFLNYLRTFESEFDYQIIFRTFGKDAGVVFQKLQNEGYINEPLDKKIIELEKFVNYNDLANSYRKLVNLIYKKDMNIAIKDNYNYWNDNDKNPRYGKPIICNDESIIHFGFDDNDCMRHVDIYGYRIPEYKNQFMKVNTLKAMKDHKYFINWFEQKLI